LKVELLRIGRLQELLFKKIESLIFPGTLFSEIYDTVQTFFDDYCIKEIINTIPVTINVNNVVYHGVPGEGSLSNGDVVTIDICFSVYGRKIDGASTYIIGDVKDRISELVLVSRNAVLKSAEIVNIGISVKDIIKFLSDYISEQGFYLLPCGMGHGVGEMLHEKPLISLSDFSDFHYTFKKGDVFTIEPIVLLYKEEIRENLIGEGLISSGNISSQFEITLYIEDKGKVHILNVALLN